MFIAGRAAMIADSRYAYKTFSKGMNFRWDVAPMPKGRAQATTFIWGGNCIPGLDQASEGIMGVPEVPFRQRGCAP